MRSSRGPVGGRGALAVAALFLALSARPATAPTAPAPAVTQSNEIERLIGLWGCDRFFGPEVRGTLTIVKRGPEWSASIAGYNAPVHVENGEVTLVLPSKRGELRGRLSPDSLTIRGHWIQPSRAASGAAYATYASPVELRARKGALNSVRAWRGEIVPLDDRVSMYLSVGRELDGTVRAFFRNPQRNYAGRSVYAVALDGARVLLSDPKTSQLRFEGSYDARADRLMFQFVAFGGATLDFTRRGPTDAPGFYPRTPLIDRYEYRPPLNTGDGWATASLRDVGLDPAPVSALVQRILDTDPRAARFPYVQALLVARHGKLVLEEYFFGFSQNEPHDMRSAGKTFTTTLVGIAIDHGAKLTPRSLVLPFFSEYRELANPDSRKAEILVENLLTMSTGLACDDDDNNSPGDEDRMREQQAQPDWYKYTLDLPMLHRPGEFAAYCSATINLLGGILRYATGEWLPDMFQKYIATPLDFGRYHFNLMPTGNGYGAGGIYLRPRDAIKLGQLFLSGGVWNGHRLLSRAWIAEATKEHSRLNNGSVDGYNWWLQDVKVGQSLFHTYSASGNGGQRIIVVPKLDIVVMFTGANYNDFGTWRKFIEEFLPQHILVAALPESQPRAGSE